MEWNFQWIFVTLASMFAGFVDAVVGGGGLILVPALFGAFPSAPPATLLGTNKSAGVWGTLIAARQFSRRVQMRWSAVAPAAFAGFAASLLGAWAVTVVDPSMLRKALPVILVAVLAYTLYKKQLGQTHAPRYSGRAETWVACAIGASIGFYDGFFGPGAGSFFVFLFVRWLGYDFLNASASAKILNLATNIAALILFTAKGHVWWHFAIPLAVANVVGSMLGTWMALKKGSGFVRGMFIVVVSALILKTGYDAFVR
ncbi:putative membrane protein YfcA [Comamonas odontotermitis]|uniref:Probable membrane transporter protein n=1 Tax=Comamonas odontotermitis TaxID=379895 RepID=A0ABR6RB44_9BURK|nr:TSUP family transporter [Comamonas odontotermitis]MBB6576380.1 putative membrane protein YfcA [Comamonas odontotermitis]